MEKQHKNKDEVDVFELFGYIKKGFNKVGNTFLRFLNFLKRNFIIIGVLLLVGILAGYYLESTVPTKYETEAILVFNFESAEYLYKSIDEIESNLKDSDKGLLEQLGLTKKEAAGLSMEIEPIIVVHEIAEEEQAYLELLAENTILSDEEKQLIINKSYDQHKLSLYHTNAVNGEELLDKIVGVIRNNPHYKEVYEESNENLERQLNSNLFLLAQIDSLFWNYSQNIDNQVPVEDNLIYSENSLDLGKVLETRIKLQEKTSGLIVEKVESRVFIKVIDKSTIRKPEIKSFSSDYIILLPFLLLMLFFVFHIFLAINKKANKLKEKGA